MATMPGSLYTYLKVQMGWIGDDNSLWLVRKGCIDVCLDSKFSDFINR
jgi:hypothetical protein